jgi:hypothetical protein
MTPDSRVIPALTPDAASSLPEKSMKTLGVLTVLTLALLPLAAHAGDRGTDAAIGAVSGAVVFGPVGAVAGALVGFTAGPAIGQSWGLSGSPRRHARYRQRTYYRRDAGDPRASYNGPAPTAADSTQAPPASAPRMVAPARVAKNKAPPVQALE